MADEKPINGGPAFPQCVGVGTEGNIIASYDFVDGAGLSLRDYFAAKALQGLIANTDYTTYGYGQMAIYAYQAADAMLAQRGKQ